MPFEITYAVFAGLIGGAALFLPPDDIMRAGDPPRGAVAFSLGGNTSAPGGRSARTGFAGIDYMPERRLVLAAKPILSAGLTPGGEGYVAAGIRQDYRLGPVQVTPHFSVAAYQSGRHGFETRELLQFRTGLDLYLAVTDSLSVGLGYYHMSNGQLTRGITPFSAEVDVIRLGVLRRF